MRSKEVCVKVGPFSGGKSCLIAREEQFSSMLYSAKLIKDFHIRFMNGLKYGEDIIFRYECLYVCEKGYVEQKLLYLYRENEKSAVHTRKFGLDYFVPLLNGYLAMDSEMGQWANEKRGVCSIGKGIAKFYMKDMIDEHFMNFGSVHELLEVERNNLELFEGQEIAQKLSKRTIRYKVIITNYSKGTMIRLLRKIRGSYLVQKILEKRKYTIEI